MSDRIHELLHRNLQDVFGEGNAARRRAAIEELYTKDCVLYAPPGIFVGPEALDKFAGDLRATHPHFVYTPHGEAQALHNAGRLAWGWGHAGTRPTTLAWMWSSSAMERSRHCMYFSIPSRRSRHGACGSITELFSVPGIARQRTHAGSHGIGALQNTLRI